MSSGNIIIAQPANDEQINALKAFMKALKIKFEITTEKPYNPEFVAKIQESREQVRRGEYTRVKKEDMEHFLGLK